MFSGSWRQLLAFHSSVTPPCFLSDRPAIAAALEDQIRERAPAGWRGPVHNSCLAGPLHSTSRSH
jgi:hypothetical protein